MFDPSAVKEERGRARGPCRCRVTRLDEILRRSERDFLDQGVGKVGLGGWLGE